MKSELTKQNWVWALILIVSSFAVYGISLHNPYYFDDQVTIELNYDLDSLKPPLKFYKSVLVNKDYQFRGYRPTLMMSYWANIRLLRKSPSAIRLGNIFFHTANALLWVLLIMSLSQAPWTRFLAWASGLAFLFHPIQTLGINFLWKRSSILESFFILLALYLHARERNRDKNYRGRIVLTQVFFFLCAVTTKESGIILPVLLFWVDVCFYRSIFTKIKKEFYKLYLPLTIGITAYYFFRIHWAQHAMNAQVFRQTSVNFRDLAPWNYFLESLSTLSHYFTLWICPRPLLFNDPHHFEKGWQLLALITSMLFAGSVYIAVRCRKNPFVPFFLGIIWISFIPTSTFVPIRFAMDQIRLYLPLAGLSGLLICILIEIQRHVRMKNLLVISTSLLLACYLVSNGLQNMRYGHPIDILQDVTKAYPHSGIAWENLAIVYLNLKMYPEMLDAYRVSAVVEPKPNSILRYEMWDAMFVEDETARDRAMGRIDVSGVDSIAMINLIENELAVAAYNAASKHLEIARQRFPTYARVHLMSGKLWEKIGDIGNAQKAYANVLAMDSNNTEAQLGQQRVGKPPTKFSK